MNTPNPCSYCGNLYADVMCEDDPSYDAECMVEGGKWGDKSCPKYIYYEDGSWTE